MIRGLLFYNLIQQNHMTIYYTQIRCPHPSCGEGLLRIYKYKDTSRLFLECPECGEAWQSPTKTIDEGKAVSSYADLFNVELPSYEEIVESGWGNLAVSKREEKAGIFYYFKKSDADWEYVGEKPVPDNTPASNE